MHFLPFHFQLCFYQGVGPLFPECRADSTGLPIHSAAEFTVLSSGPYLATPINKLWLTYVGEVWFWENAAPLSRVPVDCKNQHSGMLNILRYGFWRYFSDATLLFNGIDESGATWVSSLILNWETMEESKKSQYVLNILTEIYKQECISILQTENTVLLTP